eukprot:scaffold3183_cov120-Isochrysis_galbana.AAC.9
MIRVGEAAVAGPKAVRAPATVHAAVPKISAFGPCQRARTWMGPTEPIAQWGCGRAAAQRDSHARRPQTPAMIERRPARQGRQPGRSRAFGLRHARPGSWP